MGTNTPNLVRWGAVIFIISLALFSAITLPETRPKAINTGMTLDWIFYWLAFFTSVAFCQWLEAINAIDWYGDV